MRLEDSDSKSDPSEKPKRRGKFDEEQQATIEETLRKNPNGPLRRVCVLLAQEHDIKISEASLRSIRSRMIA